MYESNFNSNEIKCSLCYLFCRKIIHFTIRTPGYKQYKLSVVWTFLSTTADVSKVFLFSHFIQAHRDRCMHTLKSKHTNVNRIFFIVLFSNGVGVSIVFIVTRLWTGRSGVCIQAGARNISVFWNVQTGFGTYPGSCSVVTGALSSEVKQPGCEADHSATSNAGGKNEWSNTPFHLFMIYGICRYNCTFLLFSNIWWSSRM